MWEEDEARLIADVREALTKHGGRPPRGWMGPWMSQSRITPDLLKEAGFDFLMDWPCDDQPIWLRTRAGSLMSVPYPLEINDSPMMLVRHHTAVDFERMIIDQFDEMLAQSERQPLVCGIALHTMVMGQPYRLRALRRALKYIVDHPQREKIWFTRPGRDFRSLRIAAHGHDGAAGGLTLSCSGLLLGPRHSVALADVSTTERISLVVFKGERIRRAALFTEGQTGQR